ncbi:hypothetical protein BKM31_27810 [[Actinomadura] parvosata subsp. kistnae]|uniref:Uncharacterized protein n=1 Tax=[Actinomadura] parvosata subsp. kistnae TaxID=1909395 RepID=A0A1V0A3I1_9ACTN|nr:hypothetical protein [Nonomuraea sp. ATCC 55076]AQZ64757.1 hypothetical protein BKM31_27810 [Nonomuraea sp. ATCC 55076]
MLAGGAASGRHTPVGDPGSARRTSADDRTRAQRTPAQRTSADDPWDEERDGRPRRRLLVIAAVIIVAAAVGVGGWLWLGREQPRPATFHAEPTSAFYAAIDSRQNDASPLTLQEVFTPATKTLGKLSLTATRQYTDCDEALWGVTTTGCTQALQATYQGGSMAGQFVIFNLADGRAADALVAALRKDGFVRQDVAFEAAGSRAQARAMGHYVTVSWVGATAPAEDQATTSVQDQVTALVALDGLGRVVQGRIVAAT